MASLEKLLHPRTVAVIGASEKPGSAGRIVFEQLLRSGHPVYPVNPRRPQVLEQPCFSEVADLPDEVDLAVITTDCRRAVALAEQCALKSIPFVIPVAGGFREAGPEGLDLERRLAQVAVESGGRTRILGPNTLGIFVPHHGLDTIFVEHGDRALAGGGPVAVITQSGSVGTEALGLASNDGYGLRAFVGLGNKCDLNELDFVEHFGLDPGCGCLALYVESLDQGRVFLEAARRVSRRKPVVLLKAGRTVSGARAVGSHTGRLAGSDRVAAGAFRQFGLIRAYDDQQLFDFARVLAMAPPAPGPRVAILGPAGGYGVMGADYVESSERDVDLRMAILRSETVERIRASSLPFASPHNPVDLTASATDDMYVDALKAMLDDEGVDLVLMATFFAPSGVTAQLIPRLAELVRASPKPVINLTLYGPNTSKVLRGFHDAGVVGFSSMERALRCARVLVERARILGRLSERSDGHDT